jgi:hypothetical protein
MYLKIEATFKAEQVIDLGERTTRDFKEIYVDGNGIIVTFKDGQELSYPIEIDQEPIKTTWEKTQYRPLDPEPSLFE